MSKLKFHITMTLDGFVAGPNQSVDKPFGDSAEHLHDWMLVPGEEEFKHRSLREAMGMEGGETGPGDDVIREDIANVGATIMGRNMFGGGPGPWATEPWQPVWWGDNPPFHTPVFVLTHFAREPLVMAGGTTFIFVTDGIESALAQARAAAGDKDVAIGGGANAANQYLAAGLVDEMELHVIPVILGSGARLFEGLPGPLPIELVRTVAEPDVTHLKYVLRR